TFALALPRRRYSIGCRRRGARIPRRPGPPQAPKGKSEPRNARAVTDTESTPARPVTPPGPEGTQAVFRARGPSKLSGMGEVQVHALRDVDIDLFPGELLVLLGASGSGKRTPLNGLGGPGTPTTGSAWYKDRNLG